MIKAKYMDIRPFEDYDGFNVAIELDCDKLIDRYDYHDAPYSITIYYNREELLELIKALNAALSAEEKER